MYIKQKKKKEKKYYKFLSENGTFHHEFLRKYSKLYMNHGARSKMSFLSERFPTDLTTVRSLSSMYLNMNC